MTMFYFTNPDTAAAVTTAAEARGRVDASFCSTEYREATTYDDGSIRRVGVIRCGMTRPDPAGDCKAVNHFYATAEVAYPDGSTTYPWRAHRVSYTVHNENCAEMELMGIIIGCAVGGIVLVVAVIVGLCCFCCRREKGGEQQG